MVSQLAFQTSLLQEGTGELDLGQHSSLSFSFSLSVSLQITNYNRGK